MRENLTANEARQHIHTKLLKLRNVYTVVASDKFQEAYNIANENQRRQIWVHFDADDHIGLNRLIRRLLRDDLGNLSIRELRRIASDYGIRGYWLFSKASLLSAIKQRESDAQSTPTIGGNGTTPSQEPNLCQTSSSITCTLESLGGTVIG